MGADKYEIRKMEEIKRIENKMVELLQTMTGAVKLAEEMGHIYFEEEKAQNAKLSRVEKINNEALKN